MRVLALAALVVAVLVAPAAAGLLPGELRDFRVVELEPATRDLPGYAADPWNPAPGDRIDLRVRVQVFDSALPIATPVDFHDELRVLMASASGAGSFEANGCIAGALEIPAPGRIFQLYYDVPTQPGAQTLEARVNERCHPADTYLPYPETLDDRTNNRRSVTLQVGWTLL